MSHRPLSSFRARLAAGSAGLLVATGLLVACVDPRPSEPLPPPPMAEAEEPTLYGGPEGLPGDVYAEAQPAPGPDIEPLPPEPMLEARRPGWGTMEPIPNPPGSPATERGRAYAEAAPTDGRPSERDRVGAYAPPGALPAVPPPEVYAERYAPAPEPAPVDAPFADGQPASSYPSTIVTMPPIPNPVETRREPRARDAAEPRAERRAERAEAPRRTERRARPADDRLLGGPARPAPQRRAAAEAAVPARTAARPADTSRPAAATARPAETRAQAQPEPRAENRNAAAGRQRPTRPSVNTPAGRQAALDRLRSALTTLVERDSTLAVDPAQTGVEQRVTLTLPAGLAEALTREADDAGLRALASRAEVQTLLRGEDWRIEPEEPQSGPLQAGQVSSFTWTATPGPNAGPLTADVAARLSGGGRFETLDLGQVSREVEGTAAARDRGSLLGARTIAALALLLLLALGALWYARRGNGDSSRRRFNRRRPDPVNLTPYSPAADTDAPRTDPDGTRDANPA